MIVQRYSKTERRLAALLHRFPRLRNLSKAVYQRAVYVAHSGRGPAFTTHPLVRLITPAEWCRVPDHQGQSFFGYYDRTPWNSSEETAVCHHIPPDSSKTEIVLYDRAGTGRRTLGTTAAWNHQQGAMLQWGSGELYGKVAFNDIHAKRLVCRIVDVSTGALDMLPWPIQVLHPSGKSALTLNYRRLWRHRRDYGYSYCAKNFAPDQPLEADGIWDVDVHQGAMHLLISLRELSERHATPDMDRSEHWVNHVMYSPSGDQAVFLHRWRGPRGLYSRLYRLAPNTGAVDLVLEGRSISHYSWIDEGRLLLWGSPGAEPGRYRIIDLRAGTTAVLDDGLLPRVGDGHPTLRRCGHWILTDTYPDKARQQHLLLHHLPTGGTIVLGSFFAPWRFVGPSRCDLHPRWSPSGEWVSFDSAHTGARRTYFLDVAQLLISLQPAGRAVEA